MLKHQKREGDGHFSRVSKLQLIEGDIHHLQEVLHLEGPMGYQRKAVVEWLQREILHGKKKQNRRAEKDNVRIYS